MHRPMIAAALWLALLLAPAARAADPPPRATATFAGGCFWCMEPPFEQLPGVLAIRVGYTGGDKANPTYEQVSAGGTGHTEAIEIVYDPTRITYQTLLDVFWRNVDPLDRDGQFCDRGRQYRTGIFTHDDGQRRVAEASKQALESARTLPGPIATEIVPAREFWPAEEYHQHYHRKNPIRYNYYRWACGRDRRLRELWGDAAARDDGAAP